MSSLTLAGSRHEEVRRVLSVLFCYATEKYQKNAPKRGRTVGSPPLGIPPLPWDGLGWTESASMRLASGAARSESLYRAFVKVRLCPRFYSFGGFAKPFLYWQSTRATRRIAGQPKTLALRIILRRAALVRQAPCFGLHAFVRFAPRFDVCRSRSFRPLTKEFPPK